MTIIWPAQDRYQKRWGAPLGWNCFHCSRWLPWFLKRCPDCRGKR